MSTTEDFGALTPVPLMQISTGFWAFKTLAAAHELDLFTRLAGGAETTAHELARERRLDDVTRLRPRKLDEVATLKMNLAAGGIDETSDETGES